MAKNQYRVRNWKDYNKALVNRGNITIWLDKDIEKTWYDNQPNNERGRPNTYSDKAIEFALTIKSVFRLALRSCEGFLNSIFKLMNVGLTSPCYTQICRRQAQLKLPLFHKVKGPIHMVVDSTGLKLYGEGEWKVRIHGWSKHRMWRKLHIGVDEKSGQIVTYELTPNNIGDNKLLKSLLNNYEGEITTVSADKGYDGYEAFETVRNRGAYPAILPQRTAKIRQRKRKDRTPLARDEVLREIRKMGRNEWKTQKQYHRRSLVETAIYRLKTLFGANLQARNLASQKAEAVIKINALNKLNNICKPVTYCNIF